MADDIDSNGNLDDISKLTKYTYNESGELFYTDKYYEEYKYYRTIQLYDEQGRQNITVQIVDGLSSSGPDPSNNVEQITKQVYDALGRVVEVWRGVSNASHNMGNDYSNLPTLARISLSEYDNGGVGDGLVTRKVTFHDTGSTDNTGFNYYYTFRGHLRGTEPFHSFNESTSAYTKFGPSPVNDIDWLGRTTATAQYSWITDWAAIFSGSDGYADYATTTTTSRRTLDKIYYDNIGQRYRSEKYRVLTSTREAENKLLTDKYYDRNGRLVANAPAYEAATEYAYDGAGRKFETRTVLDLKSTKYSSGTFNYCLPTPNSSFSGDNPSDMTGGNDGVVQFSHRVLDAIGRTTETHTFEMNHNDTDGIDLSGSDFVRSTVLTWNYLEVETRTLNYGCADTSSGEGQWKKTTMPAPPTSWPSESSDQILVTRVFHEPDDQYGYTVYNATKTVSPNGNVIWAYRDFQGRITKTHENYGGVGVEKIMEFEYDGLGNMTKSEPTYGSYGEETLYSYEDPYNANLQTTIAYPGGNDEVERTYYLDGLLKSTTDQNGTVIEYEYLPYAGGRLLEWTKVTTLGTNVDGHVRSIKRQYDPINRLNYITSYASTSGGTVRNEIRYWYPDNLPVHSSQQSHEGAVIPSSTPSIQTGSDYTADGNGVYSRGLRRNHTTYRSGAKVSYQYYGTVSERLKRYYQLIGVDFDSNGVTGLGRYKYNGLNRLVWTKYQPLAVYCRASEADDGTYEYLGRFGRTQTKKWKGSSTLYDSNYDYDYEGNPTYTRDHSLDYSELNRLELYSKYVNGGEYEKEWTYDDMGNWDYVEERLDGQVISSDDRQHNAANEVSGIWHDDVGNRIQIGRPSPLEDLDLIYDAWHRLVEVQEDSTTIARYEYDGLNRRIVKTVGSDTYHYYYNNKWQCLEVYKDGLSTPLESYLWHPYYVDALAARYWDANEDGDYDDSGEMHYFAHDINFNVVAAIDDSGNVVERYYYTPYGELTVLDDDYSEDSDGKSDIASPYTYTGRRLDEETGLYYYRNRYYDSQLGRFITRDPIGYKGGWNLYEYTGGNPAGSLDALGLVSLSLNPSSADGINWYEWEKGEKSKYRFNLGITNMQFGRSYVVQRALRACEEVYRLRYSVSALIRVALDTDLIKKLAGLPQFPGLSLETAYGHEQAHVRNYIEIVQKAVAGLERVEDREFPTEMAARAYGDKVFEKLDATMKMLMDLEFKHKGKAPKSPGRFEFVDPVGEMPNDPRGSYKDDNWVITDSGK